MVLGSHVSPRQRCRSVRKWFCDDQPSGYIKVVCIISMFVFWVVTIILLRSRDPFVPRDRSPTNDSPREFSVLYEAEWTYDNYNHGPKIQWDSCTVQNTIPGFSGTGYLALNTINGTDEAIPWFSLELRNPKLPPPGQYQISIRYSFPAAATSLRPIHLYVDGTLVGTYDIKSTPEETSWTIETMNVTLNETIGSWFTTSDIMHGQESYEFLFQLAFENEDLTPVEATHSTSNETDVNNGEMHRNRKADGPFIDWISIQSINALNRTRCSNIDGSIESDTRHSVVLRPGEHLERGQFVSSPSGIFQVGMTDDDGDLVLVQNDGTSNSKDDSVVIWRAGVTNGYRCYMQPGGNLVIRDGNGSAKWATKTGGNSGSQLIVDENGRISVGQGYIPLWLVGIPLIYDGKGGRSSCLGDKSNLEFPVRGAFYYPWYPSAWTVNGKVARFEPELGFYSSSDPLIAQAHVEAMDYANIDLSIASWWGPDTKLDRARITLLLDETIAQGSSLKWTIYHEDEQRRDSKPEDIKKDLIYLEEWFAWHDAWARIDGRPVIFVYNEGGCEVANRWMEAGNAANWFIVLKVFKGFRNCEVQPHSWHQYGPGTATNDLSGYSYSISPGFWRADIAQPRLDRVGEEAWKDNVRAMVNSRAPWQLLTTFNEAGEGTMIEPSPHWSSRTGYGFYLDALHDIA